MVNLKEWVSEWLHGDDIQDGDTAIILDEPVFGQIEGKKQIQCTVLHKEEERKLGINKTNAGILEAYFGTETAAWKGKRILLYKNPVQLHGKQVTGLRVGIPSQPGIDPTGSGNAPTQPATPPSQQLGHEKIEAVCLHKNKQQFPTGEIVCKDCRRFI